MTFLMDVHGEVEKLCGNKEESTGLDKFVAKLLNGRRKTGDINRGICDIHDEGVRSLFLMFNSQTSPTPFAVLEPNFTYDGLSHSSAKIAHFSMALQMR